MPIKPREDWGGAGSLPDGAPVVSDDASLAAIAAAGGGDGGDPPVAGLVGGDLWRTLGGRGRLTTVVTADAGVATVDGVEHWFVAHVIARRRLWSGRFWVALNAAWWGEWNVAPRAHPGDGRLDVLSGELSASDRLKARRRVPTGAHVPHPGIDVQRARTTQVELAGPTPVLVDGVAVGSARRIAVRVVPSAVTVVV